MTVLCLVERRGLKLNFCPTVLRRLSCVLSCFFEFFSVWAFSPETPEAGPRLPLVIQVAGFGGLPTRESRARDGQTPGRGVRSRDRAPDGRNGGLGRARARDVGVRRARGGGDRGRVAAAHCVRHLRARGTRGAVRHPRGAVQGAAGAPGAAVLGGEPVPLRAARGGACSSRGAPEGRAPRTRASPPSRAEKRQRRSGSDRDAPLSRPTSLSSLT